MENLTPPYQAILDGESGNLVTLHRFADIHVNKTFTSARCRSRWLPLLKSMIAL